MICTPKVKQTFGVHIIKRHSLFFRLFAPCTKVLLENFFRREGELGYDIFLGWIAIEGIRFRGNIKTIGAPYAEILVFDVQAVNFQRLSLNTVITSVVLPL